MTTSQTDYRVQSSIPGRNEWIDTDRFVYDNPEDAIFRRDNYRKYMPDDFRAVKVKRTVEEI